jgi:hypothetical protein
MEGAAEHLFAPASRVSGDRNGGGGRQISMGAWRRLDLSTLPAHFAADAA